MPKTSRPACKQLHCIYIAIASLIKASKQHLMDRWKEGCFQSVFLAKANHINREISLGNSSVMADVHSLQPAKYLEETISIGSIETIIT